MSAELPFEELAEKLGLAGREADAERARNSLRLLLNEGCEQAEIGSRILLLTTPSVMSLAEGAEPRHNPDIPAVVPAPDEVQAMRADRATKRTIHLRPLDDWRSALGPYPRERLIPLGRKLQKEAVALEKLAGEVAEFERTRLFRHIWASHKTTSAAFLSDLASRMNDYGAEILSARIGSQRRPDRTRLLGELVDYVDKRTKREHYRELSDILTFLCPDDPGFDAEALKQWAFRQRK